MEEDRSVFPSDKFGGMTLILHPNDTIASVLCSVFVGLFNLRGSDIEYNPVFFSYAVVTMTSVKY